MKKCIKFLRAIFLILFAFIVFFVAVHQLLTIVLLPGLGTAAPILDFMPLATELSKTNRVVIVKPFGYGWSDITNDERTLQKFVNYSVNSLLHQLQ